MLALQYTAGMVFSEKEAVAWFQAIPGSAGMVPPEILDKCAHT